MFSVSLQRDTIDVGGNVGMLSIGELPSGIPAENMTWVPLRRYSYAEGGLPAPPDSPREVRLPTFLGRRREAQPLFLRSILLHGKSCWRVFTWMAKSFQNRPCPLLLSSCLP